MVCEPCFEGTGCESDVCLGGFIAIGCYRSLVYHRFFQTVSGQRTFILISAVAFLGCSRFWFLGQDDFIMSIDDLLSVAHAAVGDLDCVPVEYLVEDMAHRELFVNYS